MVSPAPWPFTSSGTSEKARFPKAVKLTSAWGHFSQLDRLERAQGLRLLAERCRSFCQLAPGRAFGTSLANR